MNDELFSRRGFLAAGLAAGAAAAEAPAAQSGDAAAGRSGLFDIDYAKLLAPADLVYDKPAPRSEEGIPVGNGRMGTLVWTTPSAIRMQINRVDVYASNSYTNSFFERHNDYCGGCGYVDVDCGGAGDDVFPESGFPQRLSLHDGLLTMNGKGARARILGWPAQDVMAVAVEDSRRTPEEIQVRLRMLRYETKYFGGQLETMIRDHIVMVQNRNHTAASQLRIAGNRILLTQDFREGDFCSKSAVAVGIVGRASKPRIVNETSVELDAAAGGSGSFTILIATAASFDPQEDVATAALRQLEAAAAKGFAGLAQETRDWWREFWSRGFVHLHSADGEADFVEQNYHYFLYVMASSSRGKLPPKFNGMIWNTGGDQRTWGTQHWYANLSCYYEAIPAANRQELMDPVFDMYSGMYEASATAARQQWGSQGIYIAETSFFNGLAKLPEDIAAEMQELYLLRKPWEQRSQRFREFAENKHPHSSRWNWIESGQWVNGKWVIKERGFGPYGAVNHIFGSTAKICYYYWRRYEFTQDREWLESRAYPMLKGAVEFYRNYPNLRKGADGKYHIEHVNSNESVYGARDTDEDVSSMRGVIAALLRASEILGADAGMRGQWREFLDNLPPIPTSDDPEALKPASYSGPRVFVRGHRPVVKEGGFLPDGNSLPMWLFDFCNVEARDRQLFETAQNTFNASLRNGITPKTPVSVLSKMAMAAASLGRADAVRVFIPNQIRALTPERGTAYKGGAVLANRMTLREGPQALDAQRLGRASEALHLALLQSNPPAPGEDPILHLFPAWPKEWNAQYALAARGAFLVSSSFVNGRVEFVGLESRAGVECRVRNPWGESAVDLLRDGKKTETLRGSLLRFGTRKGERILLVPEGAAPQQLRRNVPTSRAGNRA
ncbi:MAG TPA: hypothetical protein VGH38_38585 [Bryobacteraceae bacterium]